MARNRPGVDGDRAVEVSGRILDSRTAVDKYWDNTTHPGQRSDQVHGIGFQSGCRAGWIARVRGLSGWGDGEGGAARVWRGGGAGLGGGAHGRRWPHHPRTALGGSRQPRRARTCKHRTNMGMKATSGMIQHTDKLIAQLGLAIFAILWRCGALAPPKHSHGHSPPHPPGLANMEERSTPCDSGSGQTCEPHTENVLSGFAAVMR